MKAEWKMLCPTSGNEETPDKLHNQERIFWKQLMILIWKTLKNYRRYQMNTNKFVIECIIFFMIKL